MSDQLQKYITIAINGGLIVVLGAAWAAAMLPQAAALITIGTAVIGVAVSIGVYAASVNARRPAKPVVDATESKTEDKTLYSENKNVVDRVGSQSSVNIDQYSALIKQLTSRVASDALTFSPYLADYISILKSSNIEKRIEPLNTVNLSHLIGECYQVKVGVVTVTVIDGNAEIKVTGPHNIVEGRRIRPDQKVDISTDVSPRSRLSTFSMH